MQSYDPTSPAVGYRRREPVAAVLLPPPKDALLVAAMPLPVRHVLPLVVAMPLPVGAKRGPARPQASRTLLPLQHRQLPTQGQTPRRRPPRRS